MEQFWNGFEKRAGIKDLFKKVRQSWKNRKRVVSSEGFATPEETAALEALKRGIKEKPQGRQRQAMALRNDGGSDIIIEK